MEYNLDSYNTATTSVLAGIGAGYLLFMLIFAIVVIVATWKVYTKAGKPGWASIVPIYNIYTLFEVAGMNGWMFLLLCIPFVNIIISIMLYINLAKAFGKGTGFALGLIFLNPIFMLILGFGSAEYIGKSE